MTKETDNKDTSLIPKSAESNLANIAEPTNYIPSIKVTYQTSVHFGEKKADLGDFFLEDQSLGNEIQVTAIAYRYQAIALTKESKSFIESLVMGEGAVPFRDSKEYLDFVKKHADDDVAYGIDILLYLPEYNLYGVIFCKKKLLKGGLLILKLAGKGNLVSIKTIPKSYEKLTWYELEITSLGKKIEIPDSDKKVEIYESQIVQPLTKEEKKKESKRAR